MTANEKVAQRKLSMLELAQELRSVSEACRLMGYSRSQFYEIKRAFQTGGLEALLDRPPIPGSTPHKIPDELEKEIVGLSTDHPAWGQVRISDEMALRVNNGIICPLFDGLKCPLSDDIALHV